MAEPRFIFDERSLRYRDQRTGRYIKESAVLQAMEQFVGRGSKEVASLAKRLQSKEISVQEWRLAMRQEIKLDHMAAASVAAGGLAQLTPSSYQRISRELEQQYEYLDKFGVDILTGKQRLDGTLARRAQLYTQNARGFYHEEKRTIAQEAGAVAERRVLHPADHCADCVALAERGWVPVGTLPRPGQGTVCLNNCHCTLETSADPTLLPDTNAGAEAEFDPVSAAAQAEAMKEEAYGLLAKKATRQQGLDLLDQAEILDRKAAWVGAGGKLSDLDELGHRKPERVASSREVPPELVPDLGRDINPIALQGADLNKYLLDKQSGWRGSLTDEERMALLGYQGTTHSVMNGLLRGSRQHPANHRTWSSQIDLLKDRIKELDSALQKTVVPEDIQVRRGVGGGDALRSLQPGAIWRDHGYSSASLRPRFAQQRGPTVLVINVPAGTHAGYLPSAIGAGDATVAAEWELLLPRGSVFRLKKTTELPNGTVEMEVDYLGTIQPPVEEYQ